METETIILKRLKDKLRQDFSDEDVENFISKIDGNTDELKKMLLEASGIAPDKEPEEFDPLEIPTRNSFIYEDLVNRGELLGKVKLKSLGL